MSTSRTATARRAELGDGASSCMAPASGPALGAGWGVPERFLGSGRRGGLSARLRQLDHERRPAAGSVRRADEAAVRGDDPGDDGEPEPGAALAALAAALGAPEALEQRVGVVRGQA